MISIKFFLVITTLYKIDNGLGKIAGVEPSPFGSEGYACRPYENNRDDLTIILTPMPA